MPKPISQADDLSPTERWWARADALVGALLIALGSAALTLLSGTLFLAHRRGEGVHPDSILAPVFVGVPMIGFGTLLRLTARAMRRGVPGRWTAQAMVLLMPAILAAFALLSLLW